jgi:hypothetical protein
MAIPDPQPGLVLSYAYLWHHEHLAGHEEGIKERPSVIVLAANRAGDNATAVTVLPITHRAPSNPDWAVEIPLPVKRHLGLDEARSWIVVAEGNEFLWPGYDLRKVPAADGCHYGFLPPRCFTQVVTAFAAFHRSGKGKLTPRG